MSNDDPHRAVQQFYMDQHGAHYARSGNSPWHQISPRRPAHIPQASVAYQEAAPSFNFPPLDYGPPPGLTHPGPSPGSIHNRLPPILPSLPTPPVDPRAISLPDDDDEDFPPPHKLVPRIARPALKVGGSRRANPDPKGKGKQVVREGAPGKTSSKRKASAQAAGAPETKKAKGRVAGTANYTTEDIFGLLAILSERLPIGGRAWNSCADEYNIWAEDNDRPVRTSKSLEAKYKQLVKTTKPTGDADMPEYVYQAHEIEDAMNEKAGTRDLDDDDIADDVVEISSDDDDDDDAPPKPLPSAPKKTKKEPVDNTGPIARRAASDRISQPRQPRNMGANLLSTLSGALDPAAQAARQEERAARTFQTSQLFALTAQLRESQNLVESLRTRLAESDRDRNAAERRADKAEMMAMFSGRQAPQPPSNPPRWANLPSANRTPSRPVRHDVYYSDGGRGVRWVGPDDSPQLYPDSPGTRYFARYTPERVEFTSRSVQMDHSPTATRSSSRPLAPSFHSRESSSRHQQSPVPMPMSLPSSSIPSSSRHPMCIPEALSDMPISNASGHDADVFTDAQ